MRQYSGLLDPFSYGVGYTRGMVIGATAVGSSVKVKVPGDRAYRLVCGDVSLSTSAVVATRYVYLSIVDGDSNVMTKFYASVSQTASQFKDYPLVRVPTTLATHATLPINDVIIPPGWSYVINADSLDVGDQFYACNLVMEEFPIGRGGYSLSGVGGD